MTVDDAFQSGADFVAFEFSPSPPPITTSKSPLRPTPSTDRKGKTRASPLTTLQSPSTTSTNDRLKSPINKHIPDARQQKQKHAATQARPLESSNGGSSSKGGAPEPSNRRLDTKRNLEREGEIGSRKPERKGKKAKTKGDEQNKRTAGNSRAANGKLDEEKRRPDGGAKAKRLTNPECPWLDLFDWEGCRDPAEMLNAEVHAFYEYLSPTHAEFEIRLFLIELITRAIASIWPDAEVRPFGSWQTQLYLPSGDIDLVVTSQRLTMANKTKLLWELGNVMTRSGMTDTVAIISKAKVPIVKFVTREGKLNVDLSLNQTNGISAGQIINEYLEALPAARPLVLLVKAFLSQRSMNEVFTGGLGSYSVMCMVISFLQLHPKLRRSEMDAQRNLGTLLIEFFEHYGRNFNYEQTGITLRKGGGYFSKVSRGWHRPGSSFLLSIEDPQDRDNDISGGSFAMRQVRATLAGAFELLQAGLFECAQDMTGRRSGRIPAETERKSVLHGILKISEEVVRHRRLIADLHANSRVHRHLSMKQNDDPRNFVRDALWPPTTHIHGSLTPAAPPTVNGGTPMQAIIVDDDGNEQLDDSSGSESADVAEEDEEGELEEVDVGGNGEVEDKALVEEEGPEGTGRAVRTRMISNQSTTRNQLASFSLSNTDGNETHDEDDERSPTPRAAEDPAEDSRYTLAQTRRSPKKPEADSEPDKSDMDITSESSSIVALDSPPQRRSYREAAKGTPKKAKAGRADWAAVEARKAFWSAKGSKSNAAQELDEVGSE